MVSLTESANFTMPLYHIFVSYLTPFLKLYFISETSPLKPDGTEINKRGVSIVILLYYYLVLGSPSAGMRFASKAVTVLCPEEIENAMPWLGDIPACMKLHRLGAYQTQWVAPTNYRAPYTRRMLFLC